MHLNPPQIDHCQVLQYITILEVLSTQLSLRLATEQVQKLVTYASGKGLLGLLFWHSSNRLLWFLCSSKSQLVDTRLFGILPLAVERIILEIKGSLALYTVSICNIHRWLAVNARAGLSAAFSTAWLWAHGLLLCSRSKWTSFFGPRSS